MKSENLSSAFVITFLFAGIMAWQIRPVPSGGAQNSRSTETPTPSPAPACLGRGCVEEGQSSYDLLDDRYVTNLAGAKLELEQPNGWPQESSRGFLQDSKTVPLKSNGFIVAYADKLYKFDDKHQRLWSYSVVQPIIDFAVVEASNLVYGTANDNVMFILDERTGKQLYIDGRNGRAAYGVVVPYLYDGVLVQDNFVMYREGSRYPGYTPMSDGLTFWRGTKKVWHVDFPPDAEVVVNGKRIFAVTKTTAGIYVKEVFRPNGVKTR